MDKPQIKLNFENVFNLRENFVFIVYYLFLIDVNVSKILKSRKYLFTLEMETDCSLHL